MDTDTLIYLVIGWYLVGTFSFWFWNNIEYVHKGYSYYFTLFISGFVGIASWFIAYLYYGKYIGYNIFGIKIK